MDGYEKAAVAWIVTLYITLSILSYFASAGILYLACKVCSLDVWSWKLSTVVWIMMWLFKPLSLPAEGS